jgi:hypothetical protein
MDMLMRTLFSSNFRCWDDVVRRSGKCGCALLCDFVRLCRLVKFFRPTFVVMNVECVARVFERRFVRPVHVNVMRSAST